MYVSFAAIAVHKQRIRHKNPMTSAKGLDPEGESIHM